MNHKRNTLVGVVLLVLLLGVAYFGYSALNSKTPGNQGGEGSKTAEERADLSAETPEEPETEDEPVMYRDFTMYDMEGNALLFSDLVGKPIVLNFWASWCGPCTMELPYFQTVYEEHGEEVVFVMLNLTDGQRETEGLARTFIEDSDYSFPVYFDLDSEAAYAYGISSIPVTLFFDAIGELQGGQIGSATEEYIRENVEALLADLD